MIAEPGEGYDRAKMEEPLSKGDGFTILQFLLWQQVLTQTVLTALSRNDAAMVEKKLEELEQVRLQAMEFHRRLSASMLAG